MLRLSSRDRPDAYLCNAVAIWLIADGVASGWTAFLSLSLTRQSPRNLNPGRTASFAKPQPAFLLARFSPRAKCVCRQRVGLSR